MADLDSPPAPPPGFDEMLRRAAAAPAGPLDVGDLDRRVRRIRRNRRIGTVAAVLVMAAPASLAGRAFLVPETSVDFASGGGRAIAPATDEPSERSTVASTPTPTPTVTPTAPSVGGGVAVPGTSPSPAPSASPSGPRGQSSATVVISDPPGSPERRPDLPGDARHPDVMLTLVLDRVDVAQGERWKGWLEARNIGDEPITLSGADCWALWGLYRDGAWVGGQAGTVCGDTHPMRKLAPGSSVRVPLDFDTVAGDDRDKGLRHLEPGEYQAAAALRVQTRDHGHSGVWYAETLTVTVAEAESE